MEKQNICLFLNDRHHFLFSVSTGWNGICHVSVGFIWERACRESDWTHMRHSWNRPIRFFSLQVEWQCNTSCYHKGKHWTMTYQDAFTKASQEDRNAFSIILCMSSNKKMFIHIYTIPPFSQACTSFLLGSQQNPGHILFFPQRIFELELFKMDRCGFTLAISEMQLLCRHSNIFRAKISTLDTN